MMGVGSRKERTQLDWKTISVLTVVSGVAQENTIQ